MLFNSWIQKLEKNFSPNLIAFNFNLYESQDPNQYPVELIGCGKYDTNNDDWACYPDYSCGEDDMFVIFANSWEEALNLCVKLVEDYLKTSSIQNQLTNAEYITAGFVDGDLMVIRM